MTPGLKGKSREHELSPKGSSLSGLGCRDEVPQILAGTSRKPNPTRIQCAYHQGSPTEAQSGKERIWGANERHLSFRPEVGSLTAPGSHPT